MQRLLPSGNGMDTRLTRIELLFCCRNSHCGSIGLMSFLRCCAQAQAEALSEYRKNNPEYVPSAASVVRWVKTGWPDWRFYEPIFKAAFDGRMKIIAGDLPSVKYEELKRSAGRISCTTDLRVKEYWRNYLSKAHFGLVDESEMSKLSELQCWRDRHFSDVAHMNRRCLVLWRTATLGSRICISKLFKKYCDFCCSI